MPTTYAIPDGRTVMAATTWTGVSTTSAITISNAVNGVSFKPDFVWEKPRSLSYTHSLSNSVVGVNTRLNSAGTTGDETNFLYGYTSSFNNDGFTASPGSTDNENWNTTGATFVAWQWKAGGTAVTNTAGTITSQVSANTTSGFSVVTYTGNGVIGATVGHGLGNSPQFIAVKKRNGATDWNCYHVTTGQKFLVLNSTAAAAGGSDWPTINSTVFGLYNYSETNASGGSYVAYCWAPVAGYSQFGSYTGNGSANGPFIYTGFRARWLMIKRVDSAGYSWFLIDTARNPYNVANLDLYANSTDVEAASNNVDILSNGFRPTDSNTGTNGNGGTFIYAAFAENPFKYANAR